MKSFRDQFLTLALQTGIISVSEGKVKFDQTFEGRSGILRLAASACREVINDPLYGFYEVDVLFSFGSAVYNLPFLAVAAQTFHGGDGKSFVHNDAHRWYDPDFLKGKKVIVITIDDQDLSYGGAQEFIKGYGGELLGFVTLFSQRTDEVSGIPAIRLLSEEYIKQQALMLVR